MIRDHRWATVTVLAMILTASLVAESAEKLLATGTREHAWFILSSPETEEGGLAWSLSHAGSRDEDGLYRPMRRFKERPTAIGALGNNIWLAMDSTESRPNQIPIRLLQVNWDSRIDRYVPSPTGGFKMLAPVQIDVDRPGVPVDLVATTAGPTVLILHEDGSYSAQEFRQGRWGAVGLPPLTGTARLGTVNDMLGLLDVTDTKIQHWWKSDEGWSAPEVTMGLGAVIEVVQVDDRLLIMTESESNQFALNFLGPQGVAKLGTWPQEQDIPWSILGYRGLPVLVRADEQLELSEIDPLTGVQDSWRVFTMGSPLTMSLWPVLVAFMASAIVLFILLRSTLLPVPEGFIPIAPMARLMALLIDAIPAFIVVFGFLDGQARMFVDAVMLSLEQDQWLIYALMVAMICSWSLLWELAIGTSPGKLLFGARLIGAEGQNPSWDRKIRRTLLKGILLLLPVLMITALRPPSLQSASDQGAGVIVVRRRPISADSDTESDTESDLDS